MKSNSAIRFCKICFNQINDFLLYDLFNNNRPLCARCFHKMMPKIETYKIKKYKFMSLYKYNEEIRNLLFLFKACGDIELAKVFLCIQSPILKLYFHDYYLVPAPSYIERENKRGFSHVKEMFSVLKLKTIDCLKKNKDIKQADLDFNNRQKIGEYLSIQKDIDLRNKKILFVDDVVTSGATALAAIKLLEAHRPKIIKVLSMAHTVLS